MQTSPLQCMGSFIEEATDNFDISSILDVIEGPVERFVDRWHRPSDTAPHAREGLRLLSGY